MPIIDVSGLRFRYPGGARPGPAGGWAVDDVSLGIEKGSAVGIVGESGSGKSTLIRLMCGLLAPAAGGVSFLDRQVPAWMSSHRSEFLSLNQMVFQSPANSLDPRLRIGTSLSEPVRSLERREARPEEMGSWLEDVGLSSDFLGRYPHQLSGGQLQRVAIARALSVRPNVLYADEPTSALDVSVQAQILNLLMTLRSRLDLTLVFVSHDLAIVSRMCQRIVVMQNGRIVEEGAADAILSDPQTAYVRGLVHAARTVTQVSQSPVTD